MELEALQKHFQKLVRNETVEQASHRDLAFIREKKPLARDERLDAYHYAYWARLEEALSEDFECVRRMIGEDEFTKLSNAFSKKHPSKSHSLNDFGKPFPAFVKSCRSLMKKHPFLADLARLEWALIEAFFAVDVASSVNAKALSPGSVLPLCPSVRIVESDWEISTLLSGKAKKPRKRAEQLMVYRWNDFSYAKNLSSFEAKLLSRILKGSKLSQVLTGVSDAKAVEAFFQKLSSRGLL